MSKIKYTGAIKPICRVLIFRITNLCIVIIYYYYLKE